MRASATIPGGAVHALVGGLGGEHDGHQKGIGVHVMQFALGFGICSMKAAEDLAHFLRLETGCLGHAFRVPLLGEG